MISKNDFLISVNKKDIKTVAHKNSFLDISKNIWVLKFFLISFESEI